MRIWKWEIEVTDRQTVPMPAGAQVLTVQMQGGQPQLWALVDETQDAPKQPRAFAIYGTGNPMPEDPGRYIATFQTHGGDLIWHAFEQAYVEVQRDSGSIIAGGSAGTTGLCIWR